MILRHFKLQPYHFNKLDTLQPWQGVLHCKYSGLSTGTGNSSWFRIVILDIKHFMTPVV